MDKTIKQGIRSHCNTHSVLVLEVDLIPDSVCGENGQGVESLSAIAV